MIYYKEWVVGDFFRKICFGVGYVIVFIILLFFIKGGGVVFYFMELRKVFKEILGFVMFM